MKSGGPSSKHFPAGVEKACVFILSQAVAPPSIGWRWTADRIAVSKSCFSLIPSADADVCSHGTVSFLAPREGFHSAL